MKRILFLVVICLVTIGCLMQAQNKKTTDNPFDSSKVIIDPGAGGDSLIINFIEQMPSFPGGEKELFKFINKNLQYPVSTKEQHIQGKVYCRFIVYANGSISNPEIIRSLEPECDKEAIRVIKLLPKFIPGKLNGKNVRVWFTFPVIFKLEK